MDRVTLFGEHAHRLQGIGESTELLSLGRSNLARMLTLAQNYTQEIWQGGATTDELRALRHEIEHLQSLHDSVPDDKPTLPRLRMENFRVGDVVMLYLGDTPGALLKWAEATIIEKTKSHRSDWKNDPSKGYYWRHIAQGKRPLFLDSDTVAFATTEPRVFPLAEWHWLRDALTNDPAFVAVYAINARRDWQPLWCLERSTLADVAAMDFVQWLTDPLPATKEQ
jgi:hypothetical protein